MDTSKGSVKKLNEEDIRRISTSQVIASLSGACRELIDNALDAGATNIGKFQFVKRNRLFVF